MSSKRKTKAVRNTERPGEPGGAAPGAAIENQALQVVCFMLDEIEYGFDVRRVEEIIRVPEPIGGQQGQPYSTDTISYRDQTVPIIDLRIRLGYPEREKDNESRIIIAGGQSGLVGVLVDAVTQVLRVDRPLNKNAVTRKTTAEQELSQAVYAGDDRPVVVLDAARICP
jgi:purine-binding chemotaxis protein CheW